MNSRTYKLIHRVAFAENVHDITRLTKLIKRQWNRTPRNERHKLRMVLKEGV